MQAANPPTDGLELIIDAHAIVGESPVWSVADHALFWVDIPRHLVHRFDPKLARDTTWDAGQPVSALVLRESGGLVLALSDRLASFDYKTGRVATLATIEAANTATRLNDGKCDRNGRLWVGTMMLEQPAHACEAALYRVEANQVVTTVLTGVTESNGLDWSLDDRLMYYVDTPTGGVDVFNFDSATGRISDRRRLLTIAPELGVPDGMTVDAEGYLWVAVWGGWVVQRFAPDGTLNRSIALPVSQVSSCAFGGPDLSDLYITTSTEGLDHAHLALEPLAGAVFCCRPGVSGRAPFSYKG